jgi:hypothetical protein
VASTGQACETDQGPAGCATQDWKHGTGGHTGGREQRPAQRNNDSRAIGASHSNGRHMLAGVVLDCDVEQPANVRVRLLEESHKDSRESRGYKVASCATQPQCRYRATFQGIFIGICGGVCEPTTTIQTQEGG